MPDDFKELSGKTVLVYVSTTNDYFTDRRVLYNGDIIWQILEDYEVTHWMAIPVLKDK